MSARIAISPRRIVIMSDDDLEKVLDDDNDEATISAASDEIDRRAYDVSDPSA